MAFFWNVFTGGKRITIYNVALHEDCYNKVMLE